MVTFTLRLDGGYELFPDRKSAPTLYINMRVDSARGYKTAHVDARADVLAAEASRFQCLREMFLSCFLELSHVVHPTDGPELKRFFNLLVKEGWVPDEELALPLQHTYHSCNDEDCNTCRGGLAFCTVCRGAEATLPTECPGCVMTNNTEERVQAGKLDYRGGKWVELEGGDNGKV